MAEKKLRKFIKNLDAAALGAQIVIGTTLLGAGAGSVVGYNSVDINAETQKLYAQCIEAKITEAKKLDGIHKSVTGTEITDSAFISKYKQVIADETMQQARQGAGFSKVIAGGIGMLCGVMGGLAVGFAGGLVAEGGVKHAQTNIRIQEHLEADKSKELS